MQCPCRRPWPLSFCKTSGKAFQEKPYRKPSCSFQPFCPYPLSSGSLLGGLQGRASLCRLFPNRPYLPTSVQVFSCIDSAHYYYF